MNTDAMTTSARSTDPLPWYRQLWPWLLMSMPALSIVGGAVMLWLATTTPNALVVDDYYREGKAINLQLARDARARSLGLSGELVRGADGQARLRLAAASGARLPPFVSVSVMHATRAEFDLNFTLAAAGGGLYLADPAPLPLQGRWHVLIEDPERVWRLTGSVAGFGEPLRLGAER